MAKIKWKNQSDIDKEKQEQEALQKQKEEFKKKDFHRMSTKDKWELIYLMLKEHGYIE